MSSIIPNDQREKLIGLALLGIKEAQLMLTAYLYTFPSNENKKIVEEVQFSLSQVEASLNKLL